MPNTPLDWGIDINFFINSLFMLNIFDCFNVLVYPNSTIEERKKQKYYCDVCDTVFFCKLYMETHMKEKKHTNAIEIIKNNI